MPTAIIVENNAIMRRTFNRVLAGQGYDVTEYDSGDLAWKDIQALYDAKRPPDLLLTDNDMERYGRGVELICDVRALDNRHIQPSTPGQLPKQAIAIVLSSAGDVSAQAAEHSAAFVPKPAEREDIIKGVQKAIALATLITRHLPASPGPWAAKHDPAKERQGPNQGRPNPG